MQWSSCSRRKEKEKAWEFASCLADDFALGFMDRPKDKEAQASPQFNSCKPSFYHDLKDVYVHHRSRLSH